MSALNRNLLWFAGAVLLIAIGYYFADIVTYILIAWVLSMLGRPLMEFLQEKIRIGRYHMGPTGASILTIAAFYAVILGLIMAFVPTIVSQARNLSTVDYEALGEKLKGPFFYIDTQLHQIGLLSRGESLATKTQEILSTWFKPTLVGDFLESFISTAGNILVTFASVTFILFFFLKENTLFLNILHALVPNELEPKVRQAVQNSSEMLGRYFSGLVAQILAFSLVVTVLLWLFGVKNALLIGAFGGLFNVIPYVGPILGVVFGAFITISSNLDMEFSLLLPMLLKMTGAYAITQFIDNNFVGPMIFSKSLKAHPLEIFIVTLVAAKLGGIVGMVLGIPVYTVLRVIASTFFSEFKLVQRLTGGKSKESES
ncbi:MAG: AI-2E family transporter [Lewinellaceae bacterium]|nr:AI-2E family transporter [Saprospiraceae bacterium]MCB0543036.1 AI-2E family transporter [Saprospiraceae bacterium]MCB9305186.1 AI-2E family transporter [Lewinellaceae bacterium]MCB9355551.1 AI-2E family transporter [Lewinellaceae bacterium]